MKKKKKEIPVVRNEFIYGKKSLYDSDGNVIGKSNEDCGICVGAVNNGFTEEEATKIFDIMEAFASYAFNKPHSGCYALLGYKSAWLSLYYPVEWNLSCLILDTLDSNTEKVEDTIGVCRKRGIRVKALDVNKSKETFSLAKDEEGKYIVYGISGIKGVGEKVCHYIIALREKYGDFKSFEDFYNRTENNKTNEDLINMLIEDKEYKIKKDKKGNETIKATNPFGKRNIIPLILSGAFDFQNKNRYEVYNQYITLRGKKEELLDSSKYCLSEMLKLEQEYLGSYVSQHPLDGKMFPYTDVENISGKAVITTSGIFASYDTAKTKKGDKFYKIKMKARDGKIVSVNVFKNCYQKNPDVVKGLNTSYAKEGKLIFIVTGEYNSDFGSISAKAMTKIIPKAERDKENKVDIPKESEGVPPIAENKSNSIANDLSSLYEQ